MVSGCRASIFVPLPRFSTSGRKHGSDALARLKRPCCSGAPFFFRRQARSSKLEAAALRLRCFLTNFLCTLPRGPAALFLAPGLLSCAGREWKLALGSGSWVGGIEVETFDELCFEKIYVSKSLNPKLLVARANVRQHR